MIKAEPEDMAEDLKGLREQWKFLSARLEASERNNSALRAHVQELLAVMLKLNASIMVWKCATAFFAIALITVVVASLYI